MDDGVSFERDIKPLFSEFDRSAMLFAFDLWRREDVEENAAMILDRLELGDMPCDAPWPAGQIALFKTWMIEGHRP